MPADDSKRSSTPRTISRWRLPILLAVLAILVLITLRWGAVFLMISNGRTALRSRQLDRADQWLARASKWGQAGGEIAFYQSRAARLRGDFDDARRLLDKADREGYNAEQLRYERYMALAQGGELEPLMQELHLIFNDGTDDNGEVMAAAISGLERTGRLDEALQLTEYWMAGDANDPRLFYYRGRLLEQMDQAAEAKVFYERAAADLGDWDEVARGLANVEMTLGNQESALRFWDGILGRSPEDLRALCGRGESLLALSRNTEAKEVFESVLSRRDRSYRGRMGLARTLLAEQDHQKAIEVLEGMPVDYLQDIAYLRLLDLAYSAANASSKLDEVRVRINDAESVIAEAPDYLRLIKERPDDFEVASQSARRVATYDLKTALPLLREATIRSKHSPQELRLIALYHEQQEDQSEADWYVRLARRVAQDESRSNSTAAPADQADEQVTTEP